MPAETPHDSLFRFAFTQLDVAADQLRATLPPAVVAAVQWDTLACVPGSFVDEELQQVHTDLLYRAELDGGGAVGLYVLFEHQSRPDPRMSWRLLRYMTRIWARFTADEDGPLPYIVPLVLYNGTRPWNAPVDFLGMFGGSEPVREALLPVVPQFRYQLLDLSQVDDDELQGVALRRLVLLMMKHAHRRDFWDRFPAWVDTVVAVVRQPPDGLRALEAVLRYVENVTPRELPEHVRALLVARLPPEGGRVVVTWGQIMEERGRDRGLQEGLQKGLQQGLEQGRQLGLQEGRQLGLQQGVHEGQARVLLAQLRARFGAVPEAIEARVRNGTEQELERWAERILTAESLEAMFA